METGIQIAKMFLGLAVVLGVLFGAQYALKRWGTRLRPAAADGWVRVRARHALGPRHSLVVVTVGEKHYLLGLSPEGIRLLTPIDPPRDPSPSASTALDPSAEKRG